MTTLGRCVSFAYSIHSLTRSLFHPLHNSLLKTNSAAVLSSQKTVSTLQKKRFISHKFLSTSSTSWPYAASSSSLSIPTFSVDCSLSGPNGCVLFLCSMICRPVVGSSTCPILNLILVRPFPVVVMPFVFRTKHTHAQLFIVLKYSETRCKLVP